MDVQALLDPEIAEALARMPPLAALTVEGLPAFRQQLPARLAEITLSDQVERRDYVVPGSADAPDVTLRVHRPTNQSEPLPCIYWIHGGGYILGSYLADDLRFDKWCPALNCVGVSVEYRLAPETPYPGPLDDCYAGLSWVFKHAADLRIDPARIGMAGGSAGGGLAAGLALLVRDRGEIPIIFQLLIYPMIDHRRVTASSQWEVPIWSPASNAFGWRSYLGDLADGEVPIYAAAITAADLAGLPPAFVTVGALDGFLDEDVEYAMRLTHAGVPTDLRVYPGAPHGFDALLPGTALARRARRDIDEWLAQMLHR